MKHFRFRSFPSFDLIVFLVVLAWLVLRQPPDERVKLYQLTVTL
jgi:hypothetical protein